MTKKSSKHLLYERMGILNQEFRFPLTEQRDRKHYKHRLCESFIQDDNYNGLVEHFMLNNKLTGKFNEDSLFLREFYLLMEDDEFDPLGHLQMNDKIDEKQDCILTFTNGNSKINSPSLSLPEGYTCPFAGICKSFVRRDGKKFASNDMSVRDEGDVRCFGATDSLYKPNTREMKWRNFDLLQEFKGDVDGMADLITRSIEYFMYNTRKFDIFRVSEVGDFYSQEYLDAWIKVAKQYPAITFYSYTTSIPFWVERLNQIPPNFILTASRDDIKKPEFIEVIEKYNLKQRIIVNTTDEAKELKIPIDVDDSLAMKPEPKKFALLLHGTQPKHTGNTPQARKNSALLKQLKNKIR